MGRPTPPARGTLRVRNPVTLDRVVGVCSLCTVCALVGESARAAGVSLSVRAGARGSLLINFNEHELVWLLPSRLRRASHRRGAREVGITLQRYGRGHRYGRDETL